MCLFPSIVISSERELGETLRPRGFAVAVHPNLPSLEGRGTACGGGVPIEAPQATEGFEKPGIPEHKKDFSTHRSCSDFGL